MHETDTFRKECRTEVVAKWWLPYTLYLAEYARCGRLSIYYDGCCTGMSDLSLEGASTWAQQNGYVRLGEAP